MEATTLNAFIKLIYWIFKYLWKNLRFCFHVEIMIFRLYINKSFLSKEHGFQMVIVTRLSLKTENMSLSQEIRDYFSKLIEPLATTASFTSFERMKGEIME